MALDEPVAPLPSALAPGASPHGAYAPGQGQRRPSVDERLVAPEAHAEILDGRVYRAMGANPPHATQHAGVAHVFVGVLAEGYEVAVDMLTRADDESDAAPDVSVFPSAPDPVTGGRQLEEIAFEVLDSERLSHTTAKVEKFAKRGVPLDDEVRARVLACDDRATLEHWLDRAVTADRIDDVVRD